MLGSTHIDLHYSFRPVGNTPAVNVLHDRFRPASKEGNPELVKAMFLGGGDPRNLLFSLYSESGYGEKVKWDFTCSDLEAGVLARNVFLFSLIIDQHPYASIWNIFYHFYIRDCDMALVYHQANMLLQLSESEETWSSSTYGRIMKFLSKDTMSILRMFWSQYVNVASMDVRERRDYEQFSRNLIRASMEDIWDGPFLLHGFRSAGVHWSNAVPVLYSCLREYWRTGVVAGNTHDVKDLGLGGLGRVNPLFTLSSSPEGVFAVHHDTDPLLGFHLASCFDDENCSLEECVDKMVKHAKEQFKAWCRSFSHHVRTRTVHINFFHGDALPFCYGLQAHVNPDEQNTKLTRAYTAQWRTTALELRNLDRPQDKELFDVIDCSNLVDRVGMLNALPAISPLLSRKLTSVMFTDTFVKASDDLTSTLSDLLGADVTTMSLILGLTPVAHLVGFITDANAAEAVRALSIPDQGGDPSMCCMHIEWKVPHFGDSAPAQVPGTLSRQVEFHETELAELYFKLYLTMFSNENTSTLTRSVWREMASPLSVGVEHYSRQSFVALLDLLKRRVQVDWNAFMRILLEKIGDDLHLSVGRNSFQELQVCLYLYGMLPNGALSFPPRSLGVTPYGALRPRSEDKGLLGRQNLPSIVFPTLIVPRERLSMFTKQTPKAAGRPGLQIGVHNASIQLANHHFALQCFFGELVKHNDQTIREVVPDNKGWKGNSDLIVTFPVPTWNLLVGPREGVKVLLTITPSAISTHYAFKLGPDMDIFACGLDDERLHILRQPPGVKFVTARTPKINPPETDSLEDVCLVDLDRYGKPKNLHMYTSKILRSSRTVNITQTSPCTMTVKTEDSEPILLRYPFPINGNHCESRFLPNSDGLDLLVPVSPALVAGGYDLNPFPVCVQGSRTLTPATPHIKLDKQPLLEAKGRRNWLEELLAWSLSATEHKLGKADASPDKTTAFLELKTSLCTVFQMYHTAGLKAFELVRKGGEGIGSRTFIFCSALRHNDCQGSIVLDAYAVCLTPGRLPEASSEIIDSTNALKLQLGAKEERLWKQLLPSQVECCRTTWIHGSKCEYREKGHIPLSLDIYGAPICSCGEGLEVRNFPRVENWKYFAKYATRIAITPISAVPFLEPLIVNPQIQLDELRANLPPIATTTLVPPPRPAERDKCDHCGKESEKRLKRCQRCARPKYCNHTCQKEAWKGHKKECKKG